MSCLARSAPRGATPVPLRLSVVLLGGLLVLSGCGPSFSSVGGTVTLDGQPVESGTISFVPVEEAQGPQGRASIQKGRFFIDSTGRLLPGVYRVEIRAPRLTGRKIPAGSPAPKGTLIEEEVEAIPERYNKASILRQELKTGSNTADLALHTTGP